MAGMIDRRTFWMVVLGVTAAVGAVAIYIGDGPEWWQLFDAMWNIVPRSWR
jgi:hypothetical protein